MFLKDLPPQIVYVILVVWDYKYVEQRARYKF